MRFFIVHELRGITTPDSGRMRVRASCSLGGGRAEALAGALASLEGISSVSANALVGSLLIFYDSEESRVTALTLLLGAANTNGQFGQADLPAEVEPASGNGLMPLVRYVFVRPFLPLALRVMNSIVGALPYIFKGLGALLRGTLSVDVLDAAAIGASLVMGDFRTVSMLTLLLGLAKPLKTGHAAAPWHHSPKALPSM